MLVLLAILLIFSFGTVCFATEPEEPPDNNGIISAILDGLIGLFVPTDEFFQDWWNEISHAVDIKVVGLKTTLSSFSEQFSSLTSTTERPVIVLELEDNQLFHGSDGVSVDLLETAQPFLNFMRPILNGLVAILLIIYCYKTVTAMFGE